MNIVLECDVVLSKKLESICEDGEPISIQISSVSGNKGKAIARITCKNGTSESDVSKIGETSLMLKVNSVNEDVKSLSGNLRVSNLVAGVPTNVANLVAKTNPNVPEAEPYKVPSQAPNQQPEQNVNPDAMKIVFAALAAAGLLPNGIPQNQTNQAQVVSHETRIPAPNTYVPPQNISDNTIKTFDELMNEVANLPGIEKDPNIPTNRKLTPQEAESILIKMPKLRRKAFLRNNIQSQLMIEDLFTTIDGGGNCLSLLPGAVFDLSRIPARNILNCTVLKWLFNTGKVELVNEATFISSFKKIQNDINAWDNSKSTLRVYDNIDEVGENMSHSPEQSIVINTEGNDEVAPTMYEENPFMNNIVSQLPRDR